jgi:outer membrane protein assembly factor BamB
VKRAPLAFPLLAAVLLVAGCAGATARRLDGKEQRAFPAGAVQLRWRTDLHQHGLFEPSPEECASGVVAEGRLVIGSRSGSIVGVDPELGRIDWSTPSSGGIDSEARYDPVRKQVYVGADDGTMYAVDPTNGKIKWSYRGKGAIERAAEVGQDTVYFASAADRVIALEASSGKWKWQYERETPDGFTIHGYAGPRLRGNDVLVGFADGYLVSLSGASGEVLWARSLAAVSDQFVDVDATPTLSGDTVYAASYSGGLYALNGKDGAVQWRLGIEGAGAVRVVSERLYFAAPRQGLHAVDFGGHVLWRQGLTEAGDLTVPMSLGPYLIFSGSRAGLFVVERDTGKLLEIFNPGRGTCAAATLDPQRSRLYILSNGGALYALDVVN